MRHINKVAKHLYLKRVSLGELSFPGRDLAHENVPPTPTTFFNYRAASSPLPGSKPAWCEPNHGLAVRTPALKQAKTARGHTEYRDTVVYHESELEHRVSTVLQTYRGLARLISQYPKVEYADDDGVIHQHTFDYFIELDDGTRIAVAVKYERKRTEMLDLLDRICASDITGISKSGKRVPGIADGVALVTNTLATHEAFDNAYFLLSSRIQHDDTECVALHDIVQKMPNTFRFGQLLTNCWPRAKRRTAIWRFLDLGILEPLAAGRIDELSWLRAV
ncbi:hypothetical protein [Neorhizobium huautlense]|uniref:hypothetical protein n=1 Tax=Neorhizobium huautlense TaxID=67774 RepID=UPI000CF94607|nr:hypothetical protein [Neorhizobium huautlense]